MGCKKIVSTILSLLLVLSCAVPVFAADLTDSTDDVTYEIAVDGSTATAETKTATATVTAEQSSTYSVKIPKTISLNGSNGNGGCRCNISIKGNISGNQTISIAPVDEITSTANTDFYLSENGEKADIIATATATKTAFVYSDINAAGWTDFALTVSAPLTAGTWTGALTFNITLSNVA